MTTSPNSPAITSFSGKCERRKSLTITTPEGIVFSLNIASPISRFIALAIDKAFCYVLASIVGIIARIAGLISADLAGALWIIASFLISTGYPIVMEWYWRGQTLGKRIMKLRVMDEQGLRLKFSQVVVRNVLRVADALPAFYLIGGLSSFFNAHGQRLGDLVANTIVIQHTATVEPDLEEINPGKFNSFTDYPHLVARLRHNLTPAEAGIALQALLRRNTLDATARLSLFAAIRAHAEKIAKFPPEAVEGISDEQYIRNLVDILFRQRATL